MLFLACPLIWRYSIPRPKSLLEVALQHDCNGIMPNTIKYSGWQSDLWQGDRQGGWVFWVLSCVARPTSHLARLELSNTVQSSALCTYPTMKVAIPQLLSTYESLRAELRTSVNIE